MSRKELLLTQIDELPDSLVDKVLEFISVQRNRLGLYKNDTEYLNSIPGMADSIIQGMETPVSECFESLE